MLFNVYVVHLYFLACSIMVKRLLLYMVVCHLSFFAIALPVLRFTASNYPFDIYKLFLCQNPTLDWNMNTQAVCKSIWTSYTFKGIEKNKNRHYSHFVSTIFLCEYQINESFHCWKSGIDSCMTKVVCVYI